MIRSLLQSIGLVAADTPPPPVQPQQGPPRRSAVPKPPEDPAIKAKHLEEDFKMLTDERILKGDLDDFSNLQDI